MNKLARLFTISGLCLSFFTFAKTSLAATSLNVSVFPSEIDQLEKYVITAANPDGSPFTGTLQTQYWICPLSAIHHTDTGCSGLSTNTFIIPQSGKAIQDLATYPNAGGSAIPVGKYFISWKPANWNYDWSQETIIAVTPLDMKRYFNLTDGNYYRYNAENFKVNQTITDATRIDIKNENFCNEDTTSMFFSKTSKYAYWNPFFEVNSDPNNFMVWRPRWNAQGELETKTWSRYEQSALPTNLNTFPAAGFAFEYLRLQPYQLGINQTPYVYAFASQDLNAYSGNGYVTNQVKFGAIEKQSDENETVYNARFCRDAPGVAQNTSTFNTMPIIKWYAKIIDTPVYKGPVVVVNMREVPKYNDCKTIADFPGSCPQVLREDWFMAKDLGMVRFDVKNFGGVYGVPSTPCADDPDCQKDGPMTNPFVRQELISYHVNYSQKKYLTITDQTNNSRKFNLHLNRNDFSDLNFLATLNHVQLVIDDDANWDNGYGLRVMAHVRDNGSWKNANQANGTYYVYEKELDGSLFGWQAAPTSSTYTSSTLGFNVSVSGLLYDGQDLNLSIIENDGLKGFDLKNKNIYLYLEGQNGMHGTIPLFAQGQDSYQDYTLAKIGKFTPTPAALPGDLNKDDKINIFDYNELVTKFGKPYTKLDYQNILENLGK